MVIVLTAPFRTFQLYLIKAVFLSLVYIFPFKKSMFRTIKFETHAKDFLSYIHKIFTFPQILLKHSRLLSKMALVFRLLFR